MAEYRMTIKDVAITGKYVMIRAGLDVPLDQTKDLLDPARVTDDTRIRDIIPTLRYAVEHGAKVILAAGWCGRPKGVDPDFSMAPVAKRIEQILREEGILNHGVLIAPDCYEDRTPKSTYQHREEVQALAQSLKKGQVLVLENVRYDPEANSNDPDFAEFIASLVGAGGIYVNENETQNHRPEATIITTPLIVAKNGGQVVYGLKYANVLENIGSLRQKLEDPERGSFVFGLCGRKIESDPGIVSKITVAVDLIDRMREGDAIITGGAVTYTFILAEHYGSRIESQLDKVNEIVGRYNQRITQEAKSAGKDKKKAEEVTAQLQKQKSDELKSLLEITDEEIKSLIGDSYIRWGQEGEQIVFAYSVMAKAKGKGVEVITSYDHTLANAAPDKAGMLPQDTQIRVHEEATGIPTGWLAVGEGPKTLERIVSVITNAGIYLQSGPYSIEDPRVEEVSETDARIFAVAKVCKENEGITIGAGGDTTARINKYHAEDSFSTITSAGGATLELINGDSVGRDAVEEAQKVKRKK